MPVHVVTGTDEGRVSEEAASLFEELKAPGSDDFSNEIIEGVADNAEDAFQKCSQTIEALQTLGLFAANKVVWLKAANFFSTDRTSEAERAVTGVENLLEILQNELPEGVDFLLSATGINGVRRFGKWAKKNTSYQAFDKIDVSKEGWEEQVARIVKRVAGEKDLSIQGEALELFVQRAGAETRQISNEIEKIDLYLGDGRREVSVDDVTLMVSVSHKGVIWEISRAVEKRNPKRAIELIDSLIAKNENAVGLIKASIIPTVRNLFFAKLVSAYGSANRAPAGIQAVLPKKKDGTVNTWGLKMAAAGAKNFTLPQLQQGMNDCLDADKALVTSGQDPRMVLHKLVIRLCDGKRAA
ncbi:MAG: DNA polymerase III subunit delta [Akkermansiaceae bacterium]|jgi:DNA polymerase-3 subunit delta|nr:DNA polymerase III subunit delta [Akkermansiaceae bacterium]|tara:strand:- start:12008 stop:13072 length:1065 start_codon:yes stop_codon:yes gene_type:complete